MENWKLKSLSSKENPVLSRARTRKVAQLRENIALHLPEIIEQLVIKAKGGVDAGRKLTRKA